MSAKGKTPAPGLWLATCKHCGHQFDVEHKAIKPGARCPECCRMGTVVYQRPKDRPENKKPKPVKKKVAKKPKPKAPPAETAPEPTE